MLETLDLSNCNLKEIETYAFRGLNRMVSLYLANNNLNDLTEEVFEPLENLKELYLLGNQLTRILPQTLFPLKKLIVLDMSNNRISNIDKEAFTSLSGLKDLRLTGNVMRVFAPEAFNPLKNLQNLKLQLLKTSNGMSSPPPSKTELNNCLCERKTALDWCHGRRISCLVTCAYSHEKLYDGDSRVCTDILNSFNKTEVTGNRSVAATSLSWAVLITTAVIFLLTTTLIILAVVVRKTKAQTGDENYSAVIDSES
jgi:Leucine-rich repeat (LRR) protein